MLRPIIFRIGRLNGLSGKPALLQGESSQAPLDGPSSALKNNGPADLGLAALAGFSFLLAATPAPDPQWQANAPEHQGRTHELALTQSQQFSGLLRAQGVVVAVAANQSRMLVVQPGAVDGYASRLIEAQAPTAAAAATNAPRVLVGTSVWQDAGDSFSWSQYLDYFDQPNLRPVVGNSERPGELLSELLKATAPAAVASISLVPRLLSTTPGDVQAQQSFLFRLPQYFHAPVLRPVIGTPERPAEYPSALQRSHFEVSATLVGIQPRVIVGTPERPQEFAPTRSAPRFEPVAQGIQPRILYGIPEQVSAYSSVKQPALFAPVPTNAVIRYAQPEQVAAYASEYRVAQTPLLLTGINPRVITTQPWVDHTVPSFHVRPTVPLLDIFGVPFPTYTQFDSRTRIGGKVAPSVSARIGNLTGADSRTRIGPKVNRRKNR